MKKLFVIAFLLNLNLYPMDKMMKKDKEHHHHHHKKHHHHDKLIIYPDMDKKDIFIHLTDPVIPKENEIRRDQPNEGLFSKSLSTMTAFFRYLNQS
jgi:hypothetical protein